MEKIVRCMDCGYCDADSWGAWCNKENAQLNDVCDEHKCDSFFPRIKKEASCQQLSKALCGKENATLGEMLEAAEHLKHRAEPENRLLTLGEAQQISSEDGGTWLEEKTAWGLAHITPIDNQTGACYIYTFFAKFPLMAEKYGKTWRCWLRNPTRDQMAAAKWEE